MQIQDQRSIAEALGRSTLNEFRLADFRTLLGEIQRICLEFGLAHTSELAKRAISKPAPVSCLAVFSVLDGLNDSLSTELENEAIFRIPPARKNYFEQDDLFGPPVAAAFPSCQRDIQNAGSCFALEQEDASVHHLMLVLERGLHALADKVHVSYVHANWQIIINEIEKQLRSLPRGVDRDFYHEVNAQFGFLKNAYRNHSEHVHDDPYDMDKALTGC